MEKVDANSVINWNLAPQPYRKEPAKLDRNGIMQEIYLQQKRVNLEQIKLADLWRDYRAID